MSTTATSAATSAAEIAATEAETVKLLAEADKLRAETRRAEADAARAEIEARKSARAEAAELAKDENHRVYRFIGPVNNTSVGACVVKLTEWARITPGCDIEVVFFSPGGSVIDGFALFDFLRSLSAQGHRITTGCLGMSASMAGILLQAGDHRWAGCESWIMIHRAAFGAQGKTFDIEDEVEWVKRVEKRIVTIFVNRSGGKLTAEKIRRNWDRRDWWLTSEEALALGVVDEVR
jgi:ATP-dependent Clp endopeptidase proteolytic subunit ClpP